MLCVGPGVCLVPLLWCFAWIIGKFAIFQLQTSKTSLFLYALSIFNQSYL